MCLKNDYGVSIKNISPLTVLAVVFNGQLSNPTPENVLVLNTFFNPKLRNKERISHQEIEVIRATGFKQVVYFYQVMYVVGFLNLKTGAFEDYSGESLII